MEKAKTIEIDDSIAFQSEHSFLSSMFPCTIQHDRHPLKSAEQVYWYDITKLVGDQRLYDLMGDCAKIKLSDTQKLQHEPIMRNAQEEKFAQNPTLKQRLVDTNDNLYEATRDEYFGTGLVLAQKDLIGKAGMKGHNRLKNILMDILGSFWAETRQ